MFMHKFNATLCYVLCVRVYYVCMCVNVLVLH